MIEIGQRNTRGAPLDQIIADDGAGKTELGKNRYFTALGAMIADHARVIGRVQPNS